MAFSPPARTPLRRASLPELTSTGGQSAWILPYQPHTQAPNAVDVDSQGYDAAVSAIDATAHARQGNRPLTKIQQIDEILARRDDLPEWWQPTNAYERCVFTVLCLTAIGHADLKAMWALIKLEEEGVEEPWTTGIRQITDRLNNMLLVAGLLLATAAVFITTGPPRPNISNYNLRGPYLCMLGSFGMCIGGIIVGSIAFLIISKVRPRWTEKVLFQDRLHVYCMLILLSYPLFAFGLAALLLAFGLLSSIWSASDHGVQGAAMLVLLAPVAMGALFAFAVATSHLRQLSEGIARSRMLSWVSGKSSGSYLRGWFRRRAKATFDAPDHPV